MLKQWIKRLRAPEPDSLNDVPRYPPFMKGLPAAPVDRVIQTQSELILRLKQAVGVTDREFDTIYNPLIYNYAAYVHLLPASEAHHHRGAGGLFRHGLEVALWAIQGADQVMFAMSEPPEERRKLEPRWRCGVFLAALAHDLGKPMSDLSVVDESGQHEWPAQAENLIEWAHRVGARRYLLHWRTRRHKRHESLTPLVLPRVIPSSMMTFLQSAGPELYEQILFAVSARDFQVQNQEHNPIFKLVRDADQHSTHKDLRDPVAAGLPGALGVPLERYIMDAIRRLIRERRWQCNKPGARVWVMDGSVFIVWPTAAADIVKLLQRDRAPGIPTHPDTLADVLIDRGLVVPFDEVEGHSRVWPTRPKPLEEKYPGLILRALRLDANANVFDEQPASVEATVGASLVDGYADNNEVDNAEVITEEANENEVQDANPNPQDRSKTAKNAGEDGQSTKTAEPEANTAEMADVIQPENGPKASEAKDIAKTAEDHSDTSASRSKSARHGDSNTSKPAHRGESAFRSKANQKSHKPANMGGNKSAKKAAQWFAQQGHAGAILQSLAEDFRDGHKQWHKDAVTLSENRKTHVAIRHPEGWQGAGVPNREILPMLADKDWVSFDPYQPMKKLRDIDGFDVASGGKTRRPAIVLDEEPSAHLLAIANQSTKAAVASKKKEPKGNRGPDKQTAKATAKQSPADTGSKKTRNSDDDAASMLRAAALGETPEIKASRRNHKLHINYREALEFVASKSDMTLSRARMAVNPLRNPDNAREVVILARTD